MRNRITLTLVTLTLLVTLPTLTSAQTDVLTISNDKVGIGTTSPSQTLHVEGADGTTRILARESSTTESDRVLFEIENNGVTQFKVTDSSADGSAWSFETEGPSFRINKNGTGGEEIIIRNRLDGTSGQATLTVNGSVSATNVTFSSSRELKTNLTPVDGDEVLRKLAAVPVHEWSFIEERNGRRHVGPIAEDWHAAFGLGGDGRDISLIDANGVALAAIRALHADAEAKEGEIDRLREENEDLRERLARLEAAVAGLSR